MITDQNNISTLVEDIQNKYKKLGQNAEVFLEGLYHNKLITYWDYIQVDTLLSLQKTRTDFPDEEIFVMYHQVTELYFKMILHELYQIANHPKLTKDFMVQRLTRVDRYFTALTTSFDVMQDGMEVEQYLQFRNSLTPASGFQSAQYRMIEIACTDMVNLIDTRLRKQTAPDVDLDYCFEHIYWQAAGKNPHTGEKTLTLSLFEKKYLGTFKEMAKEYKSKNLWACYQSLSEEDQMDEKLIQTMKNLDKKINIEWTLVHVKTAEKYLESGKQKKEATGGSDWKKYLHPKYQKRIFFPGLWSEEEYNNWATEY